MTTRTPTTLPDEPNLRRLFLWRERRRARARERLPQAEAGPPLSSLPVEERKKRLPRTPRPPEAEAAEAPAPAEEAAPATTAPAAETGAPGTVLEYHQVTPDLIRFRLAKPQGFVFLPGQSVRLEIDGTRRRYTMVSAPHEPALEFFVELVPGGRMSERLRAIRPGMQVTVQGDAKGGIALDEGVRRHLMLSTVTGVNPFISILRDAVHRGRTDLGIVLVQGASYADEFGYREELEALAAAHPDLVSYIPTVSRPLEPRNAGWQGATGRADALIDEVIGRHGLSPADTTAYACGNTGMVKTAAERLGAAGYGVRTETYD